MDSVDGSDHYATATRGPTPALLNVILDTNPHAWALLKDKLTLSACVANLEVFINAHLALNHANRVTVIASHLQRAEFLYPPRKRPGQNKSKTRSRDKGNAQGNDEKQNGEDVEMTDDQQTPQANGGGGSGGGRGDYANFYKPFADLKAALDSSLASLMSETPATTIKEAYSTSLAGALTLALTYTNKIETALSDESAGSLVSSAIPTDPSSVTQQSPLSARIVVVSVSTASASQYIPLMNTVFAAQRMRIPIDVVSIPLTSTSAVDSSSSFLQQAADATHGIFMPLVRPHGLLQTLLMAYLPTGASRDMLIMPTTSGVDFRAACFCHQNTVDMGYVCSVCLSIFCAPPDDNVCLTCGTPLKLGGEGWARPPAVLPKIKKKKRKREDGGVGGDKRREDTPVGA